MSTKKKVRAYLARGWAVGMAAFVFTQLKLKDTASDMMKFAKRYEFSPNRFSYYYGDQLNVPRSNAHLLLGAAALEQALRPD